MLLVYYVMVVSAYLLYKVLLHLYLKDAVQVYKLYYVIMPFFYYEYHLILFYSKLHLFMESFFCTPRFSVFWLLWLERHRKLVDRM